MPRKYASVRVRLNANATELVSADFTGDAARWIDGDEVCEFYCRLWTGAVDSAGRPKMGVRSRFRDPKTGHRKTKTVSATRLSLADHLGVRVWQLNHVLHKCIGQKRCIEPTHLFSSSQRRNIKDAVKQGRHRNAYGTTGANRKK